MEYKEVFHWPAGHETIEFSIVMNQINYTNKVQYELFYTFF